MRLRFILTVALVLSSHAVAAAPPLEVIPLNHRFAEEMAPLLRPLLAPGDVLVPSGTQLIVQTSPERLAQIRQLLQSLDKSSHRLMITVRQGGNLSREALDAEAGLQGGMSLDGSGQPSLRVRGHFGQTDGEESRNAEQRVQTLEGAPAQIQFGASRPATVQVIDVHGNRVTAAPGIGYQDITTGFAVVARLIGDGNVRVDVTPWSARPDPFDSRNVRNQQASASLQARLGEWVIVGGQNNEQSAQQSQWLGHRYATWSERDTVAIKVEDLDAGKP
ncbi:hypothetical protein MoryE10_10990 [Methylogaea oryzae]|uniref:NolW-like domain-containing protein n=2 Tax=Methylogaea oryzae TaxID=1295382 RepID=A0A8D4VLT8_9GAMM|nr:hypothetical protein MoryE10_10990 [Methylogaea oryzae]